MIDQSTIAEVKARLDIVDVIQGHMELKKIGKNYSACCPFHDEKTPSFTVNQDKQFYYCFGCGANGDVIKFYSEYNGLSFTQSIDKLCDIAGITASKTSEIMIPKEVKEMAQEDRIIKIMAADYEANGVKMGYRDKQRVRLANSRSEALREKWGI